LPPKPKYSQSFNIQEDSLREGTKSFCFCRSKRKDRGQAGNHKHLLVWVTQSRQNKHPAGTRQLLRHQKERAQTRAVDVSDIREIEQNLSLAARENLRHSFHEHFPAFNIELATQP